MIKVFFTKQFLAFLFVGGAAALLHWLARIGLSLWLPFAIAISVAYMVGMTVSFLLNNIFVFPNSNKTKQTQIRDFILVNLSFFPLVWYASIYINIWLKTIGINSHSEELAHGMAISLPILATFLLYKFVAFKEK